MTEKPTSEFFTDTDCDVKAPIWSSDKGPLLPSITVAKANAKAQPLVDENRRLTANNIHINETNVELRAESTRLRQAAKVAEDLIFNIGIAASAVLSKYSTANSINPIALKQLTDSALAEIARIKATEGKSGTDEETK